MSLTMDWAGIVSIIGGVASIIGAYLSYKQSKEAKKAQESTEAAKEATEAVRDKIFQNIQYENFASFHMECSKFESFLLKASKGKDLQGKSEDYVEDELEKFLTRFNVEISKTAGGDRDELQGQYDTLCSKRSKVNANDRNAILGLLDDVRKLSRSVADIQMKNKLSV